MADVPSLEALGISYVMGALLRLDAHVIQEGGGYGVEVTVPRQAVPELEPGTSVDAILRLTVGARPAGVEGAA